MDELDLKEVHRLCRMDAIYWTEHVSRRLIKRRISPQEIITTLMNGKIIEQYPTDYPFPSCLVFSIIDQGRPLHVVCSDGNEQLFIITAYQPAPSEWDSTFTVRKKDGESL